jgi:hypothetical protein
MLFYPQANNRIIASKQIYSSENYIEAIFISIYFNKIYYVYKFIYYNVIKDYGMFPSLDPTNLSKPRLCGHLAAQWKNGFGKNMRQAWPPQS